MLDDITKRRINSARDILVGKLPDPKSQVEQITIALIYKFMDDMDRQSEALPRGKAKFFAGEFKKHAWRNIFSPQMGGHDVVALYGEAIQTMNQNPNVPQLFRDIFKNAYLPYRDPETLKSFLKEINEFEYDHSERLGDAFEYLLSVLGSQGDAGQFRTPRNIIDFMVEILEPKKNEKILDPACGTAGFLISAYKHIIKHNSKNFDPNNDPKPFELQNIKLSELTVNGKGFRGEKLTSDERKRLVDNITGYDISPDMVRLSLVNMYLHGFSNPKIYEYDTLSRDDKWDEKAEVILANPPFMSPKGGIKPHSRFSVPSNRSEVLFVDYMAEHLTSQGRAAIIVPEGVVFQTANAYVQLRKMLTEESLVGVISLPAGLFNPYSGVKTSILWLDKQLAKKTKNLLFVKIENDGYDLGAQRRPIRENDLPIAYRTIMQYKELLMLGKHFKEEAWQKIKIVEKSKISKDGDYSLSGERYVDVKVFTNAKWPMVEVGEVVTTITPPTKMLRENFGSVGSFPIIDQSQEEISGWTNDESGLVKSEKPLVIFGDHTCAVKYTDKPFAQGADGIKILLTNDQLLPRFLYYVLKIKPIETDGYQRHFAKLKRYKIPLPTISVQEEIVMELEGYQKVVSGARQIVENYKPRIEVKSNWPVLLLGDIAMVISGQSPEGEFYNKINQGLPFYQGKTEFTDKYIGSPTTWTTKVTKIAKKGDILMSVRAPVGPVNIATQEICIGRGLAAIRASEKVESLYLFNYLKGIESQIKGSGGAVFDSINRDQIAKIRIPLPTLVKQKDIVATIEMEQGYVNANSQLLKIFERKIDDCIARVWGEK